MKYLALLAACVLFPILCCERFEPPGPRPACASPEETGCPFREGCDLPFHPDWLRLQEQHAAVWNAELPLEPPGSPTLEAAIAAVPPAEPHTQLGPWADAPWDFHDPAARAYTFVKQLVPWAEAGCPAAFNLFVSRIESTIHSFRNRWWAWHEGLIVSWREPIANACRHMEAHFGTAQGLAMVNELDFDVEYVLGDWLSHGELDVDPWNPAYTSLHSFLTFYLAEFQANCQ